MLPAAFVAVFESKAEVLNVLPYSTGNIEVSAQNLDSLTDQHLFSVLEERK